MNNQLRDFAIREIVFYPSYFAGSDGIIYSSKSGSLKPLASRDNGRGYLRSQVGGRPRAVHVLIALAFIGPRPDGMEINHKDGIKVNNKPENLEYVTRSVNMKHCHTMGLAEAKKGVSSARAVLTNEDVAALREAYDRPGRAIGDVRRVIIDRGLNRAAAYQAASRRTWKHLP